MTTMTLTSTGCICSILQRPHATVLRAVEALGLTPTARINGVAHFTDEQVEQLRVYFSNEGKRG